MSHWRSLRPRGRLFTDHARRLMGDLALTALALALLISALAAFRLAQGAGLLPLF